MRCGTRLLPALASRLTRLLCSIYVRSDRSAVARGGEVSNIICDMGFQTHDIANQTPSWQSRLHSRANQDAVVERAPHHQPISHRNAE